MQQNWDYTTLTTKKGSQHHTSEQLATKAIAEGKDVETVKKNVAPNKHNVPTNVHKILEAEEYKADTVSFEFKVALQKARQAKKLTQADLAKLVMEKQSVISEYESGKAIPNPAIISKLEKALGVRLPRDKKKKKDSKDITD